MTRAKAPPRQARQILPGQERRRSQRVMIRVPVTLQGTIARQVVAIRAATVAVSDHGAMVLCPRTLGAETKLEIQNDRTRQKLPRRLTRSPGDSPEGYLIPVEFEVASPGFWRISFPPTDWKPPED